METGRKRRLLISFSGGRTSAYMLYWLLNEWPDRHNWEIVVVFANTGKEAEETLQFVQECGERWGINIVWVEARHKDENGQLFSKKGWKTGFRIVSYLTASRNGEPFEEMISVLGLPCSHAPFCSYQLKKNAIESYLRFIGWRKGSYYTAIGIRADEADRITESHKENRIIYPLIGHRPAKEDAVYPEGFKPKPWPDGEMIDCYNPKTKKEILLWWRKAGFDLRVDALLGNCDACWKKSFKTLRKITIHHPDRLSWWQEMTDKYGHLEHRKLRKIKPPLNFYRGNHSPKDLFLMAEWDRRSFELFIEDEKLDGCSESCEPF